MSTPTSATRSRLAVRSIFSRYVLPLLLLVLVVGGLAWITQNHRRWWVIRPAHGSASCLVFATTVAQWSPKSADGSEKVPSSSDASDNFKEFEVGSHAHYDFPFHNSTDQPVEVGLKELTCDCSSVRIAVLGNEEWEYVTKAQKHNPAAPLPYRAEPDWHDLLKSPVKKSFKVEPDQRGILRVLWHTRKLPPDKNRGIGLNLKPKIWAHVVGDPNAAQEQELVIHALVTHALRVHPERVSVGTLTTGGDAKAEFYVWSPTRDKINLTLASGPVSDPLLVISKPRPLAPDELARLKDSLRNLKIQTHVLSAYHATVTVLEANKDTQMEQGTFHRTIFLHLDGRHDPGLPTFDIVGRVYGDVEIGGGDDFGKIRFKPFDSKTEASASVELSAPGNIRLEPHKIDPPGLKVKLDQDKKEPSRWRLTVTIPANEFAGSFTESNAVVLRIVGEKKERFVRIPLEGHGD